MMRIEERHPDILQNIEFFVVQCYQANPHMTDYSVARVYDSVLDIYAAESSGRAPRKISLGDLEQSLAEEVKAQCDWRMGRGPDPFGADRKSSAPPEVVDVEIIVACVKRLRKSVDTWTKRSGRQGYLNYISAFIR